VEGSTLTLPEKCQLPDNAHSFDWVAHQPRLGSFIFPKGEDAQYLLTRTVMENRHGMEYCGLSLVPLVLVVLGG